MKWAQPGRWTRCTKAPVLARSAVRYRWGPQGTKHVSHRHTHTTEKGVDLTGRNNVITVLPGGISVSQA